jgi:formyltetrahydrofolate hydrolase
MPDTKSVRVQLREDTKERLKEIALRFDCTYGGEPSLTALLSDIASGQLQLTSFAQKQKSEGLIIQLSIILPFYFSGIIYLISKSIAASKGNIYELNTNYFANSNETQKGILNILVHLPNLNALKHLLKNLHSITLDSLCGFNEDKLEQIQILESQYYHELKQSNQLLMEALGKDIEADEISATKEKIKSSILKSKAKLIIDIRCTLGMEITVKNEPGIASEITKIIAESNILISNMNVKRDNQNKGLSHIELYLFFQPFSFKEAQAGIEKINRVQKLIEEKEAVVNVEVLDMMVLQSPPNFR